jgi:hypothetical protein
MSTYRDTLSAMFTASPHRRTSKIRRNMSTRLRQIARVNAINTVSTVGPVKLSAKLGLPGLHRLPGRKIEQLYVSAYDTLPLCNEYAIARSKLIIKHYLASSRTAVKNDLYMGTVTPSSVLRADPITYRASAYIPLCFSAVTRTSEAYYKTSLFVPTSVFKPGPLEFTAFQNSTSANDYK